MLIAVIYDPYDLDMWGWAVPRATLVFFFGFASTYWIGTGLRLLGRDVAEEDLAEREAYLTVGLGWLLLSILSMIPFLMLQVLPSPVDAFFEAMSGLTATGATVLDGTFEDILPSVMMWRAFLQFIGGMGIIVLSIAVLARLTHGGAQVLQAEVPGPTMSRLTPRLVETARLLWAVYLALSGVLFAAMVTIFLVRHEMSGVDVFYEALLHTFTTISTGGFSNHGASIAFFDDPVLEAVMILFMLISGTNYTLLVLVGKGHGRILWRDFEWRFYMLNFILVTLFVVAALWRTGTAIGSAIRGAAFTVASLMTSSGFVTADYDLWPPEARWMALFIMVAGGSAGSTSGGMKMARILLLFKMVQRELKHLQHPHSVVPIRIAGHVVKPQTMMAAVGFFLVFMMIWAAGAIILMAQDPAFTSIVDAAGASLAAISNIGPAFGVVGPTMHYGELTAVSKLVLAGQMWCGRLEIFTVLLLFTPATWRH